MLKTKMEQDKNGYQLKTQANRVKPKILQQVIKATQLITGLKRMLFEI